MDKLIILGVFIFLSGLGTLLWWPELWGSREFSFEEQAHIDWIERIAAKRSAETIAWIETRNRAVQSAGQ